MIDRKTLNFLCIYIVIMVSFCFMYGPRSFAADGKMVIFTEEWPPYNYVKDGEIKGLSVEIVRQIGLSLGRELEFKVYPSMRAARLLRITPRSMFISMFRTPEREAEFHWIGPLVESSIYFYKRKDSTLQINSLEDARNVPVIASRNAGLVHNLLKRKGFLNLDDSAKDGLEVYKKLLAGRVDLGISDSEFGVEYILKNLNLPLDSLVRTPVKIIDMYLYIAANKDVPLQEVHLWQEALDKIKSSGLYDEILRNYGS